MSLIQTIANWWGDGSITKGGMTAANIDDALPQSLEAESVSLTWNPNSPNEGNILRSIPVVQATQQDHEFIQLNYHSNRRLVEWASFPEDGVPIRTRPVVTKQTVVLKQLGLQTDTTMMAALSRSIRVNGAAAPAEINLNSLHIETIGRSQQSFLFEDTSLHRLGASAPIRKGLRQLVREHTDGTLGTTRFGQSHIIDLEGAYLTASSTRDYITSIVEMYGTPTTMFMSPRGRANYEGSIDGTWMLPLTAGGGPFTLGQQIQGFETAGQRVAFLTDNMLTPDHVLSSRGRYTTELDEEAPGSLPLINSCAAGAGSGSKWDAASAGDVYYYVAEVVNGKVSAARRYPSTPGTYLTVAANEIVTFSVSPGTTTADCFVVWRGTSGLASDLVSGNERPWLAFRVSNSASGGAVTFYDKNEDRPNTDIAILMQLANPVQRALTTQPFDQVRASMLAGDIKMDTDPTFNAVARAVLGPNMWQLEMGRQRTTSGQPMIGQIMAPELRNPQGVFWIKNIKRSNT